jgi:hypothetical protein
VGSPLDINLDAALARRLCKLAAQRKPLLPRGHGRSDIRLFSYRDVDPCLSVPMKRNCQTPVLILPDDIPAHPYAVAMECAMLAPKAEVSIYPWKEPKERIPLAVRQIRSFLRAHRPASA